MKSLLRGVGCDLEHRGDVAESELLPRGEPEHLGVGGSETRGSVEHESVFDVVNHGLVCGRHGAYDQTQPLLEPAAPRRASPLVTDDPVRDAVEPQQRSVACGDVVESAPGRQECLGDDVVHEIRRDPPPAVVVDRSEVPVVELRERALFARAQ